MHVQANALYASLFGFASAEELTSVPLIDLIAGSRQKDFKAALKRYGKHPEEQTSIDVTGLRTDGSEFAGQLALSTAHFEGEPCMQVLVRTSAPAVASSAGTGGIEALLGAVSGKDSGFLLLVGIDGYALHCRTLGVNAANRLIEGLGALLQSANGLPSAPLRIGDAVLAVSGPTLERSQAIDLASQIILQVSERVHAVGSQSVSCTACVVALALELVTRDGAQTTIDRGWSALAASMERSVSLRGSDPERVQLLAAPSAATASSGTSLAPEIHDGGFRILFQPIVSLRGDSTEHYEVHVRRTQDNQCANDWLAAEGLADASLELDKWVFIEALKKLSLQLERHPQTRVLLPVGVQALRDPEFAQWLALALHGAGLSAETLVVQVSHRDVAANLGEARHLAERVRALGSQLCVSEVHTANNPVADLIHLKPQLARLDGAMAAALKDSDSTNTLLKPLVEAMHHEQIASIMPEVESAGMLAVLWQLGVNYIQGSYLQPPQPDMRYDFTDLA
jgi:EAL domain-containing protein (putative c-di-GMP-specific phosphodiesterase class I)